LDQLNENLTKIIQAVRQGQELKAALKPPKGESGTQPGAEMNENKSESSTQTARSGDTEPDSSGDTKSETKATYRDKLALAAAKLPAVKMPDVMAGDPCCGIVANPALKGRLGRLVLAFPQGANAGNTRTYVYKDQTEIARFDGNKTLELMPGTYRVGITSKWVEGVTIQSGHDTTVKVGMLRVTAGKDTRIYLLDTDQKRELARGDGTQELGFPIGTVYVQIAGQSEAVTIQAGKITDF
jgi:hypothetical protein